MGKIAGYAVSMKFGDPLAEKGIFDAKISQKSDDIEVTDSLSAGDSKEFMAGLIERTISFSMWFRDEETNRIEIGQTVPFEMTLTGKKYTGTAVITEEDLDATMKDAVKVSYNGRITGVLTLSNSTQQAPEGT